MPSETQAGPSPQEIQAEFDALIHSVRAGVLITMSPDGPFGSHVPFLVGKDWTQVSIHISQLALHTKNLARDPRIALFIAEPDRPEKNPLALQRINLQGEAKPMEVNTPLYSTVQASYIARFPHSAMMFQFADFRLWTLEMAAAHFVAGFGRAFLATRDAPATWIHQGP